MKSILIFLASLIIAFSATAQIEIKPAGSLAGVPFTASINGDNNKPFWLGVGNYAHIYLDSSENHKVGIGTAIRAPFFNKRHNFHAKFHIRHAGGPSNTNLGAGPHLLLDEATSSSPAVIRFRQSTTTSTGSGSSLDETLVPGARYWDIRGFASSTSTTLEGLGDYLNFINSSSVHASSILSLRGGTGRVGINTENPLSRLHVIGDGRFSPTSTDDVQIILEGGVTGQEGRINYNGNQRAMTLKTDDDIQGLKIDNGFVTIGSHSLAPEIKTWFNTITLSSVVGISTVLPMPTEKDNILSINIMYNKNNGNAVELSNWELDNTTLFIDNTETGAVGKTVRVFVTYRFNNVN
jgi:hypothetical protein